MKHALTLTLTVAKQIGGFGMSLDADPFAVDFYQKLGLDLLEGAKAPEPSPLFFAARFDGLKYLQITPFQKTAGRVVLFATDGLEYHRNGQCHADP